MKRLNRCADGKIYGRTQGGARWQNYATCATCGKRVQVTKRGLLRPHGTYVEVDPDTFLTFGQTVEGRRQL